MSTYLEIALSMKHDRANYELDELDEESPSDMTETAHVPEVNSSNSCNSYFEQPQKLGWNVVLKCPWLPGYWCSCGASVGGEYPQCPFCGASKSKLNIEAS